MRSRRPFAQPALLVSTALIALARAAPAQVIAIRTVPIAQGDQFQIFPSANLGMGSVSIALADTLLDPFVNPAMGARVGAARFYSAPTIYGISQGAGGGRTLPLATLAGAGPWFAGFALAVQQVDPGSPPAADNVVFNPPVVGVVVRPPLPTVAPKPSPYANRYAFAMLGRKLPGAGLALAASALWARLTGVDGVDLLYPGNSGLQQFGHALDLRVGLLKEWTGARSLEALALYDRFGMTDDVTYQDPFWDPATQQIALRSRLERNHDQTNTWGLHVGYTQPLGAAGWRIGWLATANGMTHPKLPEYELANVPVIPRDPGRSSAYNLGIGLSKTRGPTTLGIDAIYEPIWSYTWADATAPVVTTVGATIPVGGKTFENHFRFSNALLRMGVSRAMELQTLGRVVELQLGLIVRSVHYGLAQADNVQGASNALTEGWVEWTPTWGLSLRFPDLEIRYRGRVTKGTGRPGIQSVASVGFFTAGRDVALAGGGILVAPSGPLSLQDVSTTTHQVSISLPLP
ncbi:MAG TPA: hypothetical protein VH116_02420 [Gemmatimonadales bacterium]|jgi:hypothetical protein|nr:hypothetical protein [Gemmatimonadales bacterium]